MILMAAALTASVPATALADQVAGQIALNGEAASEDVVDEESPVDMDQTEEADDENHEESEDAGLEETDEAEAGTEESDPEESEPEESEEEVKEDVKYDQMNAVGFHIPGAFDKVLAIEKCWLQDDISNQIRNAIRDYAYEHNYSFFNLRSQEGMLRNLMIRTSSTGELMVLLQCKIVEESEMDLMKQLLAFVAERFPQITSLLYVVNNKCNDTINDLEVMVFKGNDHIFEEMEGLRFKIGAKSFYQTNSGQAYNLYKVARNFAGLTGKELVYDLYTGTGTIANFVSRQAKKVIGIEYVPEAIEDAKVNSAINGIDNTLFYAGDMKDILTQEFINQHGRPDVIITDPPRAGMHNDVINTILFAEPQRIVYVSCNPATQARDLSLLDAKYKVMAVQPVDMFPHTHHVENVVLLEKRG